MASLTSRRCTRARTTSGRSSMPSTCSQATARQLPLSLRKINLARLLKRRIPGVFIAEYEQGEIGRDLIRVACSMCLEGIVSKRRDCDYAPGKCRHWVKTKNPAHPAYSRVRDQALVSLSRKSRAKP